MIDTNNSALYKSFPNPFRIRHADSLSGQAAIIQTLPIPVGRSIDSVRLYHYKDQYGRYTFNNEDALQDWENGMCSDDTIGGFIIDPANGQLIGNPNLASGDNNRGRLHLAPLNWARYYTSETYAPRSYWSCNADEGAIRIRLNDIDGGTGEDFFACRFNYDPDGNGADSPTYAYFRGPLIDGGLIRW